MGSKLLACRKMHVFANEAQMEQRNSRKDIPRVKRYIESISKSRSALGIGSGRTGSLCELRERGFEVLVQLVVRLLGIGPVGSSGYGARPI